MIYIIIYLIGYVIAYILNSRDERNCYINNYGNDDEYNWDDVKWNLADAIFSWIKLVFYSYIYLREIFRKSKPPRWL